MLKSATSQIKTKDTEIARLRKKLKDPNWEPPQRTPLRANAKKQDFSLPSINDSHHVDILVENLREPTTKMERLTELAAKYKSEQNERDQIKHLVDHFTMTDKVIVRECALQCDTEKKPLTKEISLQYETPGPIQLKQKPIETGI